LQGFERNCNGISKKVTLILIYSKFSIQRRGAVISVNFTKIDIFFLISRHIQEMIKLPEWLEFVQSEPVLVHEIFCEWIDSVF
jgi:hypothetical protein